MHNHVRENNVDVLQCEQKNNYHCFICVDVRKLINSFSNFDFFDRDNAFRFRNISLRKSTS